jgi:glutamine amidotransferase
MIVVVDYGMGNLDSVVRAFSECGATPVLARDPSEVERASAVVLPGVGAFSHGMARIRELGLDEAMLRATNDGVPLLGLCLGMQLLASRSDEGGETEGLGLIPGEVRQLDPGADLRVPHIGWNEVDPARDSPLFHDIPAGTDFYFVHSYHVVCDHASDVLARTEYGGPIASAIGRDNVFGVQFHPEKSQKAGFRLLRNFIAITAGGVPPRAATSAGR